MSKTIDSLPMDSELKRLFSFLRPTGSSVNNQFTLRGDLR